MSPVQFPECNCVFGPPPDLDESQCRKIPAFQGEIEGGSCDGLRQVVVAYRLSESEIKVLSAGGLLYFSMIGGLAPHYPSLSFHDARHPA
jgi:hypothetical protein